MNEIEKAIDCLKGNLGGFEQLLKSQPDSPVRGNIENQIDSLKTAITALEAQQADRWIPVTKRLPEDRGYPPVICCNVEDDWTDAAIVSENGHFINCEGEIIRPTHWIPLPEPWKEEQS